MSLPSGLDSNIFFQRLKVPKTSREIGKVLASRKVVFCEEYTEDYLRLLNEQIPTAKSGTDEQYRAIAKSRTS